jgi:hypothetical protein
LNARKIIDGLVSGVGNEDHWKTNRYSWISIKSVGTIKKAQPQKKGRAGKAEPFRTECGKAADASRITNLEPRLLHPTGLGL